MDTLKSFSASAHCPDHHLAPISFFQPMVRGSAIGTGTEYGRQSNQVQLDPQRLRPHLLARWQGSSYEFCVAALVKTVGMQWGGDLVQEREYEREEVGFPSLMRCRELVGSLEVPRLMGAGWE